MDCKEFKKRLNDYLSDDISYEEKSEMKSHMDECPNCAAIYNSEKNFDDMMYDMMSEGTDKDLCSDIDKNIGRKYSGNFFEKMWHSIKQNIFRIAVPIFAVLLVAIFISKYNVSINSMLLNNKIAENKSGSVDIENINDILSEYKYLALPGTGVAIVDSAYSANSKIGGGDNKNIKNLYWTYCNELSKACGFDMSPYKGKCVTVYVYNMSGSNENGLKCFAVAYKNKIIGIWLYKDGDSWINAMSLDGKKFKDVTKLEWSKWLAQNKLLHDDGYEVRLSTPEKAINDFLEHGVNTSTEEYVYTYFSKAFDMNLTPFENNVYDPLHGINGYEESNNKRVKSNLYFMSGFSSFEEDKSYDYTKDNDQDDLILNRHPYEKRRYIVHCKADDFIVTVSKEEQNSLWQIDGIKSKNNITDSK